MKTKNRKIIIFAAVFCTAILGIIAVAVVQSVRAEQRDMRRVQVYFLNQTTLTLEPEAHHIPISDNAMTAGDVLRLMLGGPRSNSLVQTFPDSMRNEEGRFYEAARVVTGERLFEIYFSDAYHALSPMDEQFFRASLVWTMTGLNFIDNVHIFVGDRELLHVNGEPMGLQNRQNLRINPSISPAIERPAFIRLYFHDMEARRLAPEDRLIMVDPSRPREWYVVAELIRGTQAEGLTDTVPPETRILGEIITEEGICYVNLSQEFASRAPVTEDLVLIMIHSIVSSLTALEHIEQVQFTIEGVMMEDFRGGVDLSAPFSRDERWVPETIQDEAASP